MPLFSRKPKCPYCGKKLSEKPTRKIDCPHCGRPVHVRMGELVTSEEAEVDDWLLRLNISRKEFDKARMALSREFKQPASVNDTVWRILNDPKYVKVNDPYSLEQAYRNRAALLSMEGKDPTKHLIMAEEVRRSYSRDNIVEGKKYFLGHDELSYARRLRSEQKYDTAETFLKNAEPSPAVLDELRKLASARAREAKKNSDWKVVVRYLEEYDAYAAMYREHLIKTTNQEPPAHTSRDTKMLEEARQKAEAG